MVPSVRQLRRACCITGVLLASVSSAESDRWKDWSTGPSGARTLIELPSAQMVGVRTIRRDGSVVIVTTNSTDGGRTWADGNVIADDAPGTDLGDSHLLRLPAG